VKDLRAIALFVSDQPEHFSQLFSSEGMLRHPGYEQVSRSLSGIKLLAARPF
jgi:hypothetical protein